MNAMKSLTPLALVAASICVLAVDKARSAPDSGYQQNDLLLYFLNPNGNTGTDQIAFFSLGSTWSVFRNAATPTDPNYGTVINLGNMNEVMTATYGNDWATLSSSLFMGAAGNNGSASGLSSAVANGDFARTVYVTKPRLGAGTLGQPNSSTANLNTGNSAGTSSAISGANSPAGNPTLVSANPFALPDSGNEGLQSLKDQNPFGPTGAPATAYGAIQGGLTGPVSSVTYTYGSVGNVALGLDLYRITPSTSGATAWQNVNNIQGVSAGQGYYLGTITISPDGEVNFVVRSDEAPVTDDYTAWAEGYPGADLTDKEGDYDRDGFKNVVEYAFGTNPTLGNTALSSATAVSNNLTVGFFRRSTANDQAPAYSVLSSTDLGNAFTNNGASISILTNSAPPGYQAASFTQPVSGSKVFYRINATLPQDN